LGTHELSADGVVVGAQCQGFALPLAGLYNDFVQHDFAQGVRGAQAAGDAAHGGVAIAGQRGLDYRQIELQRADG